MIERFPSRRDRAFRRRASPFGALVVAVTFAAIDARVAAQRGIDVERFRPALDAEGFLGLQGTATPGPGRAVLTLATSWSHRPLLLTPPPLTVIAHRVTADLSLEVGVGGRWALALDLPIVAYQRAFSQALDDGLGVVPANAVGDPRLSVRWRMLGEDARILRERPEGPGIALQATTSVPAGEERAFAGDSAAAELRLLADFHLFGAGAGVGVGWRHRFETRAFAGVRFGDEIDAAIALKLPIP
ncbi:MAG: hypothetical protein NZ898_14690, partial [Myxococcota bacterium]|nr:hypothetical protein [Myxococcota bacterium]